MDKLEFHLQCVEKNPLAHNDFQCDNAQHVRCNKKAIIVLKKKAILIFTCAYDDFFSASALTNACTFTG